MGLKTWNPNFCLEFSNRKIAECLFRRSVCFKNFPLKRRKQPETELMVSLAKHRAVASWFTHDVIQVYRLLFGIHVAFFQFWDPGEGGTPYNGLYGEAPPARVPFFRLQVYERVGILLVSVVYERVEKSVISVCERAEQINFIAL